MKIRTGLALIAATATLAFAAPIGTATPTEVTAEPAPVSIDFDNLWGYETVLAANAEAIPSDCTVVNPGTPFCYLMCDTPPRLRECPDE